jgi:hypothetical protein
MVYWKEVLAGLQSHFRFTVVLKNGVIKVSDFPFDKHKKQKIGNTTYIVTSFFKNDAKGDVVDKVRRMIERDFENISDGKEDRGQRLRTW